MANLGKTFADGESIVVEGEAGDCMYIIQKGEAEVFHRRGDSEVALGVLKTGDFFGEMALFESEIRSATVRARGPVSVLTVNRENLFKRISEDPTMAFRLLQKMSARIRNMDHLVSRVLSGDRRDWKSRPDSQ